MATRCATCRLYARSCGIEWGMPMLRGGDRDQNEAVAAPPGRWRLRWLELTVGAAAAATPVVCLTGAWPSPLVLVLLLAVPPALAGIDAVTFWRPLGYGFAALAAAVIVDAVLRGGITV